MSSTQSQPTGSTSLPATATSDSQSYTSLAELVIQALSRTIDQLAPIAGGDSETICHLRNSLHETHKLLSRPPEVVAGFVGVTGSGKSTIINALLRARIVPTSGLKSCTSTPIRISHHLEKKVKAWIHYIPRESWLEEIGHLLRALIDARGSISKLGEDGKEAWQRISVVYPHLAKLPTQTLMAMSAEDILASDPAIARRLGNHFLLEADPSLFPESLQDHTIAGKGGPHLWPIISQISIQCNAPILKDGLTLLDLPGVLDSNTARASIAAEHLNTCDHIFVVAPIKRAVTDQVAQELMGDAFRAQLRMDGKYTTKHIALIASCCDDIECTEIVEELGLGDSSEWKSLSSRLQRVREQLTVVETELQEYRAGEPQSTGLRHGHNQSPLKRSGEALSQPMAKRPKLECDGLPVNEPGLSYMPSEQDVPTSTDLSTTMGVAPSTYHDVIAEKEAERHRLEAEEKDLQLQCMRYCIAARNAWTRSELQEQFQCGLDDTKGDSEFENEEAVTEAVSVFIVSARESLRLQDKTLQVGGMPVCQTDEETGVPGTAASLRQRVDERHHARRESIADRLSNLVSEMQQWLQVNMRGSQQDRALRGIALNAGSDVNDLRRALLQNIALAISTVANETCATVLGEMDELAFHMRQAAAEAGQTIESKFVTKIAKRVTHHNTLKAAIKRFGRWKEQDWNASLVAYLQEHFATIWDQVLALGPLDGDADKIHTAIEAVLSELEDLDPVTRAKQVTEQRASAVGFVPQHARTAAIQCRATITSRQKRISRKMHGTMDNAMHKLYESACNLSPGIGFKKIALATIREYLSRHAEDTYSDIVEAAISDLRATVDAALKEYAEALQKLASRVEAQILPTIAWKPENPHQNRVEAVAAELEHIAGLLGQARNGGETTA